MCVKSKQESFAAWKDSSDQICKTVKLLFPMHKVSVLQNNLLLLAFVAPIAPVTIASSLPGAFLLPQLLLSKWTASHWGTSFLCLLFLPLQECGKMFKVITAHVSHWWMWQKTVAGRCLPSVYTVLFLQWDWLRAMHGVHDLGTGEKQTEMQLVLFQASVVSLLPCLCFGA